jgi:hypothetical protein
MKHRSTTKEKGDTVPVQGQLQDRVPRAPHERDESADSQEANEPSQARVGAAAHDSLERGETDTDKGPVLDATYEKEFRR